MLTNSQSYHDVAVRLEPIILELEREQNDLLIIAHESVLRVLYGYLMACSATDIPILEFPRNEIIEVSPHMSCVHDSFITDLVRSFRRHTATKQSGSTCLASQASWSHRVRRISRSLYHHPASSHHSAALEAPLVMAHRGKVDREVHRPRAKRERLCCR